MTLLTFIHAISINPIKLNISSSLSELYSHIDPQFPEH